MQIFEAKDEDLRMAQDLWDRSDASQGPRETRELIGTARKPPSSSILVAKKVGEIIAVALVGVDGHRGWIYDVRVDKPFRRQGVGKVLVSTAEEWLRRYGAFQIYAKVRFTNLALIGFYSNLEYCFQDMVVVGKQMAVSRAFTATPKQLTGL